MNKKSNHNNQSHQQPTHRVMSVTEESQLQNSVLSSEIIHNHLRIVLKENEHFVAIFNQQKIKLSVAMSCLIQPQIGDLVLSSMPKNSNQGYILAILESPGATNSTEIKFPGNVSFSAPNGSLNIYAQDKIELKAQDELSVEVDNYVNNAQKVVYNNKHIAMSGKVFRASFKDAFWNCSDTFFIKTMNNQLHCKESLRRVNGHEEVLTHSFRQYVENNWVLHTRSTSMYADETTSIKASLLSLA